MDAVIVASSHAAFLTITDVSLFTSTRVRAVRVVTNGMFMAVVQAQPALVDIGALRICPARVR